MPVSTSKRDLRKFFSKFGIVEAVRQRCIIPSNGKTSKKVMQTPENLCICCFLAVSPTVFLFLQVAAMKKEFSSNVRSLVFYVKFKNQESVVEAVKAYALFKLAIFML